MEEKQLEILKENLERRFGLLIKNSNYHALFIAKMEYLNYLFSEKIAGEVIENLIKKFKLNNSEKGMLVLGYYDYVVGKAVRQTKLETLGKDDYKKMADNCRPPFYTSFIDSELHLQEKAFFNINKLLGLDPQLVKESIKLKLEPDDILKKMKGDSKIKKATKELVEYSKNKSIKLIDGYDVEINDFSLFHFSLIEEINDLLKIQKESHAHEDSINTNKLHKKNITKDVIVGPFSYKNGLIYYNESIIDKLTQQMIKLCFLFFIRKNEFLSYETIQSELSDSDYITKENMQKVVSKVRTALKKRTHKNLIKNISNKGYSFNAKEIQ